MREIVGFICCLLLAFPATASNLSNIYGRSMRGAWGGLTTTTCPYGSSDPCTSVTINGVVYTPPVSGNFNVASEVAAAGASSFYQYATSTSVGVGSGQSWTSARPWSWNAPGLDYNVGYSTTQALKDPTAGGLPSGCTYYASGLNFGTNPEIRCANNTNLTFDHWDFGPTNSSGKCVILYIAQDQNASTVTLSNNNFTNGIGCVSTVVTASTDAVNTATVAAVNYTNNAGGNAILNGIVLSTNAAVGLLGYTFIGGLCGASACTGTGGVGTYKVCDRVFTGSITSGALTITSGSGTVAVGDTITDTAASIPAGTTVSSGSGNSWTLSNAGLTVGTTSMCTSNASTANQSSQRMAAGNQIHQVYFADGAVGNQGIYNVVWINNHMDGKSRPTDTACNGIPCGDGGISDLHHEGYRTVAYSTFLNIGGRPWGGGNMGNTSGTLTNGASYVANYVEGFGVNGYGVHGEFMEDIVSSVNPITLNEYGYNLFLTPNYSAVSTALIYLSTGQANGVTWPLTNVHNNVLINNSILGKTGNAAVNNSYGIEIDSRNAYTTINFTSNFMDITKSPNYGIFGCYGNITSASVGATNWVGNVSLNTGNPMAVYMAPVGTTNCN